MALGASYLRPGDGVLDVGCNEGGYAKVYADKVGPTGYVRGIEPHAGACAKAREHTKDRPWMTVQQVALGAPPVDPGPQFSIRGLLWSSSNSKQASMEKANCQGVPEAQPVVITTLDLVVAPLPAPPRLIKIDAQGSEARILRGATETLDAMTSIWVVEIWQPGLEAMGATVEDVLQPFEWRGYVPYGPDGGPEYTWSHVRAQSVQKGHSSIDVAFIPPGVA